MIVVGAAYYTSALSHLFFDAPPLVNGRPDFDRLVPDLLTRTLPPTLMALILLLVVPLVSVFSRPPSSQGLARAFGPPRS